MFHESAPFLYRNAICIGIHNYDYKKYWKSIFDSVGILCSPTMLKHLSKVEATQARWKKHHSKVAKKKEKA